MTIPPELTTRLREARRVVALTGNLARTKCFTEDAVVAADAGRVGAGLPRD